VFEGAAMELMTHSLGEHGEAYRKGPSRRYSNISRACIVSGVVLLAARGRRSRAVSVAAGAVLAAGALATRWAVFKAGPTSAGDPKFTVGPQRERIARGERQGAARAEAKVAPGHPELGTPATAIQS
jgi:hypothetical protein